MIGIDAIPRVLGGSVVPPNDAGRSTPNPQSGGITPVQQLGVVAFDDNIPEEFDSTGYWVWADGVWVEWFDGEVIEQ